MFLALTNTVFALSPFYLHHMPDEHFWNKITPPMAHAENINACSTDCLIKKNINLSHTLDNKKFLTPQSTIVAYVTM